MLCIFVVNCQMYVYGHNIFKGTLNYQGNMGNK